MVGNGADYKGTANVSVSGAPCLAWNDGRIRHVLAPQSRSAVARLDRTTSQSIPVIKHSNVQSFQMDLYWTSMKQRKFNCFTYHGAVLRIADT